MPPTGNEDRECLQTHSGQTSLANNYAVKTKTNHESLDKSEDQLLLKRTKASKAGFKLPGCS